MGRHPVGELFDFIRELRQRAGVAFGKLADAAGEGLRDAVKLALHGGGEGGEPLVVHDERLDFVLGQLGIFGGDFGDECLLDGLTRKARGYEGSRMKRQSPTSRRCVPNAEPGTFPQSLR
jgi:hypothetical protein